MKEIVIARYDVNRAALQETLEAQLSPYFIGVGTSTQRGVSVFLVDEAPAEVEIQAQRLVETHDNRVKTADQEARAQRNQQLSEVTENADAALTAIAQAQAANLSASEILAGNPTDADVQAAVQGLLQREATALQREARLVQALRYIAPTFISPDLGLPSEELTEDQ